MAHVVDVARYILERQGPETTLKLQKLVYYVHAWAVAKGPSLISDTVKAWRQGPVVPALYHEHRGRRRIAATDLAPHGSVLTAEQRIHIDGVLSYYGGLPPKYLSEMTHHEQPWREAREFGARWGHNSPPITDEALRKFYSGRTPEDLEADFQMTVAREVMDKHAKCLARLAL